MIPCPTCPRPCATARPMPCGRELPDGIAEQFLQLHCCLQQLADTIQSGRADESALVGHAVFRLARVMTGEAERASNL